MEMCLAFYRHPGESRDPSVAGAAEDAKSRESRIWNRSFSVLQNPLPINALNALRDGASCSDPMGCGR